MPKKFWLLLILLIGTSLGIYLYLLLVDVFMLILSLGNPEILAKTISDSLMMLVASQNVIINAVNELEGANPLYTAYLLREILAGIAVNFFMIFSAIAFFSFFIRGKEQSLQRFFIVFTLAIVSVSIFQVVTHYMATKEVVYPFKGLIYLFMNNEKVIYAVQHQLPDATGNIEALLGNKTGDKNK